MARADLFNFSEDAIKEWAQAVSEILGKTILFRTQPDGSGSADAGPLFRLNPTQVVAYDLFSATRHVESDANEGDAASVILLRGVSVDPSGESELLSTVSGGNGTAHIDTDMRYLIDRVVSGESGLSIGYHTTGGTNTGNTLPGIMQVPLSLNSFGETPDIIIEQHTHEDNDNGGTLGRLAFFTGTVSFSGTFSIGTTLFELQPNPFFPMIHVSDPIFVNMVGHTEDADNSDAPRFALIVTTGSITYDVDYRYVEAN
jgi:hypothetical protein